MSEALRVAPVCVAIVGSGPAGLSAACHAARLGMSHVLLEKTDHLSDTIFKYQKGKHVMATPVSLTLRSDCEFDAGKRERMEDTLRRRIAALGKSNNALAIDDALSQFGNPMKGRLTFQGIPIRNCDQITLAETLVS